MLPASCCAMQQPGARAWETPPPSPQGLPRLACPSPPPPPPHAPTAPCWPADAKPDWGYVKKDTYVAPDAGYVAPDSDYFVADAGYIKDDGNDWGYDKGNNWGYDKGNDWGY